MKKLITALLLAGASMSASADTFQFDPEQDTTFIDVDIINSQLLPNFPVDVRQYFGADGLLNDGDAFTEQFTFNFSNATPTLDIWAIDELNFNFDLAGTISNVVYGAGVPDLADLPGNLATFQANLAATSFDLNFTNTMEALSIDYNGTVIGVFDLVATTTTDTIALDGSNTNVGFVFNLQFNEAWALGNAATLNSVWRDGDGDLIDIANFDLFAAGSAGPNGTSDGLFFDQNNVPYIDINVKDNGAAFTARIPEPSTVAMLGLALLGFAGSRRKAK